MQSEGAPSAVSLEGKCQRKVSSCNCADDDFKKPGSKIHFLFSLELSPGNLSHSKQPYKGDNIDPGAELTALHCIFKI